jgi:hypothetical protein
MIKSIKKDYFKDGYYHNCRFCGTPIRKSCKECGGALRPLGNFAQYAIPLQDNSTLTINGCKDCIMQIRPDDHERITKADPMYRKYCKARPSTQKCGQVAELKDILNAR